MDADEPDGLVGAAGADGECFVGISESTIRQYTEYARRYALDPQMEVRSINTQLLDISLFTPDDIYDPNWEGMLFVKSAMGTGKTKCLMEHVRNYVSGGEYRRICLVSFRISFSEDHLSKLNKYFADHDCDCRFELYKDIDRG